MFLSQYGWQNASKPRSRILDACREMFPQADADGFLVSNSVRFENEICKLGDAVLFRTADGGVGAGDLVILVSVDGNELAGVTQWTMQVADDTDSDARNFHCTDDMDFFPSSCLLCPLVHRRAGHVASIIVPFEYRSDI